MNLFKGSIQDIYIHWLVLLLGISVFISGMAIFTTCRSFASFFNLLNTKNQVLNRIYKKYYRYHVIYWIVFLYLLITHLMVTITHVRLPINGEPFIISHQAVFYSSIINFVLVLAVFFSCRTMAGMFNFFRSGNILNNSIYKKFYRYHLFYWLILAISVGGHIVFGMIHAMNT
ncbi:MAG: hypothetical protein M1308_24245 [Actinobacteria bacterium]|nr:hypothetical protein [Actinomycetota bacterium]